MVCLDHRVGWPSDRWVSYGRTVQDVRISRPGLRNLFLDDDLFRLTQNIGAFAVVYGIFLSFSEFGPGNCTFMLATKAGPTAVRGHFLGIAAAMGKVGAFTGIWAFPQMIDGE